jgi:hypothetical protein
MTADRVAVGFSAINQRCPSNAPTRVYVLFRRGGGFSAKTIDYHGTSISVAATSIRQAYAVAHKDIWIDPEHKYPVGIVSTYQRDKGTTLWCGCSGHSVKGGQPKHGAGVRALRVAIEAHSCDTCSWVSGCNEAVVSTGRFCLKHALLWHRDRAGPSSNETLAEDAVSPADRTVRSLSESPRFPPIPGQGE